MNRIFQIAVLIGVVLSLSGCPESSSGCKSDQNCPAGRYCDSYSSECLYDCTFDADCRGEDRFCSDRGRCEIGCSPTNGGIETCDGLDNDCDELTDEDLSLDPCEVENQFGRCAGLEVCSGGQISCNAQVPQDEECDGLDNDCDQLTDEDLDGTQACPLTEGVCAGTQRQCQGDQGWTECDYGPDYELDQETLCDDLDNDCDGQTDEDLGHACPLDQGVCAGVERTCLGAAGYSECDYGLSYQETEDLCDGLDNDCDGQTDEETVPNYSLCEVGPMAADLIDNNCDGLVDEPGGCMVQLPGRQTWIDVYENTIFSDPYCSQERYGATSDDYPVHFYDTDNAPNPEILYACSLPGILPSTHVTSFQARRACEAQGKRLCNAVEWPLGCGGGDDPPLEFTYGDTFVAGQCNDFTMGTNSSVSTGQSSECVSPIGTYDQSGNLFEWVDQECSFDSDKQQLNGGSFECTVGSDPAVPCDLDDPGHADTIESRYHCHHSWHSTWCAGKAAEGPGRGFRCCWDGP